MNAIPAAGLRPGTAPLPAWLAQLTSTSRQPPVPVGITQSHHDCKPETVIQPRSDENTIKSHVSRHERPARITELRQVACISLENLTHSLRPDKPRFEQNQIMCIRRTSTEALAE